MKANVSIQSPDGTKVIPIRCGLGFQALCAKHETAIEFSCRESDCGICAIRVLSGSENLSPTLAKEKDFLNAMRADSDERLACQVRILGDVAVAIDGM